MDDKKADGIFLCRYSANLFRIALPKKKKMRDDNHRKSSAHKDRNSLSLAFAGDSCPNTLTDLVTLLILFLTPVLAGGCSRFTQDDDGMYEDDMVYTKVDASVPRGAVVRCIDIFFFNDDKLQRLDSYQRMEGGDVKSATGASRVGKKILVVLANASENRLTWTDINSLSSLSKVTAELANENPAVPMMCGIMRLETGNVRSVTIPLEPLMSKVELVSIKADFSGRSYAGAKIENIKAYLTNVSGTCRLIPDSAAISGVILNSGRLSQSDLSLMAVPGMLMQQLDGPVGASAMNPEMEFCCYPSESPETGPGTPPTRLVLEGSIEGSTYYYPVEINRGAHALGKDGIGRNSRYRISMNITRKGADTPDTAVDAATAEVHLEIVPWLMKPATTEIF